MQDMCAKYPKRSRRYSPAERWRALIFVLLIYH
ncbi:hypothetical protein CEXT_277901, partial [Caerostris extrusa]